jgi:hypothetical protein
MQRYYDILGIPANAGTDAVRRAYRLKAKTLHPDRNPSAQAHEEFILLNEAYDAIMDRLSGKSQPAAGNSYEDELNRQREASRRRAAEYARMKYAQFVQSDHYRSIHALNILLDYILMCTGMFLLLGIPLAAPLLLGWKGLMISVVFAAVTYPLTIRLVSLVRNSDSQTFWRALNDLLRSKRFLLGACTLFNVLVFFRIALNTLIPLSTILFLYILPAMLLHQALRKIMGRQRRLKRYFLSFCAMPFLFSILLCTNYFFSGNEYSETIALAKRQESTLVRLKDNAYDEYAGMRLFSSYEMITHSNQVTYYFAEGLLGFRVVKGYRFEQVIRTY